MVESVDAPADSLTDRIFSWYDCHRRDLPWRATVREAQSEYSPDPYRVWISEVMLIQTRVETVIPYYNRFIERFPDVHALAAARLDDVLKLWEGLGYYARARNLHRAAQFTSRELGGRLPGDSSRLKELPGIGDYVSAAVASIAFGERIAAIDGNLRRVLARLHDIEEPTPARLRDIATSLIDGVRPGDSNQALMDIGSEICTPRNPLCDRCPLEVDCLARKRGTMEERPKRRPKKKRPHFQIAAGVIWRGGEILIARRKPEGLLGGLWEFPGGKTGDSESLEDAAAREILEELGVEVDVGEPIAAIDHAYSHFSITLNAFHCRYLRGEPQAIGCAAFAWVKPSELDAYAFPAANKRLLDLMTPSP